jgi:hypothetical protein
MSIVESIRDAANDFLALAKHSKPGVLFIIFLAFCMGTGAIVSFLKAAIVTHNPLTLMADLVLSILCLTYTTTPSKIREAVYHQPVEWKGDGAATATMLV